MPKYRYWTQGAVECYSRGCVCQDCELFEILGKNCKMKESVLSLFRQLGAPPDDFDILNNFNKIIDDTKVKTIKGEIFMFDQDLKLRYGNALAPLVEAVKKGYTSYPDLERETGQNNRVLSVNFADLASSLIRQHLVKDHQDKTKKQIVIDFIQSRLLVCNIQGDQIVKTQGNNDNKIEQELKERCNNFLEKLEESQKENQELRKRIEELENQPKQNFDFDSIRRKIKNEIDELGAKLKALDLLEGEFV